MRVAKGEKPLEIYADCLIIQIIMEKIISRMFVQTTDISRKRFGKEEVTV